MAETNINSLMQDERFQRQSFPDKVLILERAGLSPEDATQRALDAQKAQPQGPSVMDPGMSMSGLMRLGGELGLRAAPSIAGEVGGELVAPFMGLPRELGGGVGAMAGEGVSQLFGLNPMSFEQLMLAGAVGATAAPTAQAARIRGLVRGGRVTPSLERRLGIAKRIPGAGGAIQELAKDVAESIPGRVRQSTDVFGRTPSAMFTEALAETGVPELVSLRRTSRAVKALQRTQNRAKELGLTGGKKLRKDVDALAQLVDRRQAHGGRLAVNDVDLIRRDIEGKLDAIKNRTQQKQYRQLLRGLFMDIDDAVRQGNQQAAILQDATALSRRNFAADDIQNFLDRPGIIGVPAQGSGAITIRLNRIQDAVRRARTERNPPREFRLLKGSVPDSELQDIEDLLGFWNEASTAIPPPPGTPFGSGPTTTAGLTVAGLGTALTGSPAAGIGAAAGLTGTRYVLGRILMSPRGRAVLRQTIEQGQPIDLYQIAGEIIAQSARQSLGDSPSQMLQNVVSPPQLSAPR